MNKLIWDRILILSILISGLLQSGISQGFTATPFRKYATQKYNHEVLSGNSVFEKNLVSLEDSIIEFKYYGNIVPRVVPVVFHILQSPGMPFITDSVIYRQLSQLNFDYNFSGPGSTPIDPTMADYESRALLPYIYFCLPDSVGDVSIEENLIRRNVEASFFPISSTMKSRDSGGSDPVLPDQCLNIWICNLPDSIAGYAQYPGGPSATDGIVISYKYLIPSVAVLNSLDYNKGKTLTHLVGNYLGVYELWNEENPCYDDYVYDTPIHNEPNHGFDMYFGHITTCPGNDFEMIINFMDNTFDSLAFMFTKGQVDRMHCVLNSPKYRGLISNTMVVCNDTGTSIIDSITAQSTAFIEDDVKVYPNPTRGDVLVEVVLREVSPVTIFLFDMSGKKLLEEQWDENSRRYARHVGLTSFSEGLYYLSVRTKFGNKIIPITLFN